MFYIYTFLECWDGEPDNRPAMNQVASRLKEIIEKTNIITEYYQIDNYELNTQSNTSSNISQSSQMIRIMEIESTTTSIPNKNILGLSIVIDELVILIIKKLNEGKDGKAIKQHVFDYMNDHKIMPQKI